MTKSRGDLVFIAFAGLAVVAAVVAGIRAIGTPSENRVRRFDDRRIADLRDIQEAISLHWSSTQALPKSLAELRARADPPLADRDPVSGRSYEYRRLANDRYELCATFSDSSTLPGARPQRNFWSHPAGHHCFVLQPTEGKGLELQP